MQPEQQLQEKDDKASRFLSDALKASFTLLKIIMVVLLVLFLFSGLQTIDPYEKALVLTFGKISGEGEARILEPGLKWVWPYPIQEIVRIPVGKKTNLVLESLWYYERPGDKLPSGPKARQNFGPTLNPLVDGYCLTRGEKRETSADQADYNIVHAKWQLTYQITDPELFYKNAYVNFENIEAGQNYADVIEESIKPMLGALLTDAAISTVVHYTIDDVLFRQIGAITDHIKRSMQQRLNQVDSGITVVSIQLDDQAPPRQVADAFWASIQAANTRETIIKAAQSYYDKSLNEAGGPVAEQLLSVIEDKTADPKYTEQLWSQLAGEAQNVMAKAHAYRTRVVENAKANADYFRSLLPEYRKRPKLVVQKIWQDTVQEVFDNADEKMIIQSTKGTKGKEIRISINRDPAIKKRKDEKSKNK